MLKKITGKSRALVLGIGLACLQIENTQSQPFEIPGDLSVTNNITSPIFNSNITGSLSGSVLYSLSLFQNAATLPAIVSSDVTTSQGFCFLSGLDTNNSSNAKAQIDYSSNSNNIDTYQLNVDGGAGVSAQSLCVNWPPTNTKKIIYATQSTYTGNLGGFSGADEKCNSGDSNKPNTDFSKGYIYKAMLNGNNATTAGVTYYRADGTTQIATATGGNLVGAANLVHSIENHRGAQAWTGWTGADCVGWTNNSSSSTAGVGFTADFENGYWSAISGYSCSSLQSLYCVSQ